MMNNSGTTKTYAEVQRQRITQQKRRIQIIRQRTRIRQIIINACGI